MRWIIFLFCFNIADCLTLIGKKSKVDVLEGENVQLVWDLTIASGESFNSGSIVLRKIEESIDVDVGEFRPDGTTFVPFEPYIRRGWSVKHDTNLNTITLSIISTKSADDGNYTLKLSYFFGQRIVKKSSSIKLNVLVKPFFPSGSFNSGEQILDEGKAFTIKCEPEGSPKPIKIIWEKNLDRYKETDSFNSNLVFDNLTRNDGGKYVCKASNQAGTATVFPTTTLVINYKPVNTLLNTTVVQLTGSNVDFKCSAEAKPPATFSFFGDSLAPVNNVQNGRYTIKLDLTKDGKTLKCVPSNRLGNGPTASFKINVKVTGKPAPVVTWLKNGAPVRDNPGTYIRTDQSGRVAEAISTFRLSPARRNDNGDYGCEARNLYGRDVKTVRLNLLFLPDVTNKNDFYRREVREGERVELKCTARGNPPVMYYIWRYSNGTVIQNKTVGVLTFDSIQIHQAGKMSCAPLSYVGEGKKQFVEVFVIVPPKIIISPPQNIFLNESQRLLMICNATGIPVPWIYWRKDGKLLNFIGERLSIDSVTYRDRGEYICIAGNGVFPNSSSSTDVIIYFRPVIETTSSANTIVGEESGREVSLVCTAVAFPPAHFNWLSYPSMINLNESSKDVLMIIKNDGSSTLRVKARYGVKYVCQAYNNLGNATQVYEIRPKGIPEAPYLKNVKTYIKNFPNGDVSKVYADVEWIPGYDGGDDVWFVVYYGPQQSRIIYENHFTIKENLKADEDYVFYVKATNNYGPSKNTSNHVRQRTQAFFGSAYVERFDDGKIIRVQFIINTKENLTKEVRFRKNSEKDVWDTRKTSFDNEAPFLIKDLDPNTHYVFEVLWYSQGVIQITYAGEVLAWKSPTASGRSKETLTKEEIIAIIAGVGGFLLVIVLILFLCLIRKRQKPKRDENVVVMRRQPESVDMINRRSLIGGSVYDDSYESSNSGNKNKKKKGRDSYYLPNSEDMNTFTIHEDEKRSIPDENSKPHQPHKSIKKSPSIDNDSEDDSDDSHKQRLLDNKLSSEPDHRRVYNNGKSSRNETRDVSRSNDENATNDKSNNNQRQNRRGAPPPYKPRTFGDNSLPPYHEDNFDLDDASGDDPLPPPMPVLPHSSTIPEDAWSDRYGDSPRRLKETLLEREKSQSRNSLGSENAKNAKGKLRRPSSRHSLSESGQQLTERETPTRESFDMSNDESTLVSYLV
ncbi:neural cell adhesion molecule 2-like isoform X2 [Xenia sp. Carnegie-2017]|uniref:neural cell adhesion molecule 2-like isoform X2 n=1 Tax=Xenia sp. Carnegie-2017 TaxID=2897299 RepID=UPI001F037FCE|nr:neural cell adhesion molecule 2-like isoform X2 [Xenia sp. Carnegie-2017]